MRADGGGALLLAYSSGDTASPSVELDLVVCLNQMGNRIVQNEDFLCTNITYAGTNSRVSRRKPAYAAS